MVEKERNKMGGKKGKKPTSSKEKSVSVVVYFTAIAMTLILVLG